MDKMKTDEELTPFTSHYATNNLPQAVDSITKEEPIPCMSQATEKVPLALHKENKRSEDALDPCSSHTTTPQAIENLEIEDVSSISHASKGLHNLDDIQQEKESTSTSALKKSKGLLDSWTKDEKYQLYLGIKYRGSKNVKEIQETIPSKTLKEIEAAIDHYKNKANQKQECTMKRLKVRRTKTKPLIPLASWAKLLTDNLSFNELQTELISAIRLIADLEDIPTPEHTDQIDFRKIYHHIADAMEGKSIPDDRLIAEVLNTCVLDTALVSRLFIKPSTFRNVINSVNFKDKEIAVFPRPTQDNKLAILRHLSAQRNYNPLSISEEHLMPSVAAKINLD